MRFGNLSISEITFLLGLPVILFSIGIWILSPIDKAAREKKQRVRFTLADFLCLFVTVQFPLSVIAWLQRSHYFLHEALFWFFMVLAWIIAPIIWVTAAMAISRAGVVHGTSRMLFMGVIVPIVYYGLLPFSFCVMMLLFLQPVHLDRRWMLSLTVFLGCGLVISGVLTRKIVKEHSAEA